MSLSRSKSLALLSKCVGNEIWSVQTCRESGVPQEWIDVLADAYESGFKTDNRTIYVGDSVTNQYHGIRDVDLAMRLGRQLGIDVDRVTETTLNSRAVVQAIVDAVMEGE